MITNAVKKIKTLRFCLILFYFFGAIVSSKAQAWDSMSRSQMFDMKLSEIQYKNQADLLNLTKTLYDTLGYDSIVQKYYPSGQLYKQSNYLNGKLHGDVVTYHSNGKLESEEQYNSGECTDSQFIRYDMLGFVDFESWKIRYRRSFFLCVTKYNRGSISSVQIFDSQNPQEVYAGFMWVDGEWKPRNHHYQNSFHAHRLLKRYRREYDKRHPDR